MVQIIIGRNNGYYHLNIAALIISCVIIPSRAPLIPFRVLKIVKNTFRQTDVTSRQKVFHPCTFIIFSALSTFYFPKFSRYVSFKNAYKAHKYAIFLRVARQSPHAPYCRTYRRDGHVLIHNPVSINISNLGPRWRCHSSHRRFLTAQHPQQL